MKEAVTATVLMKSLLDTVLSIILLFSFIIFSDVLGGKNAYTLEHAYARNCVLALELIEVLSRLA